MNCEEWARRYDRHLRLAGHGRSGQEALERARVMVVGAGGLGSVVLSYLTGAGVGNIAILDSDTVDVSNLHRQILYRTDDIGKSKADLALQRLAGVNPAVSLTPCRERLAPENIARLVTPDYALVLDCTDNFETRYLLADHCWRAGIPLISGSIVAYEGMVLALLPGEGNPCLRCLMPEPPQRPFLAAEHGVLGPAVGVIASLQAVEAVKSLRGSGTSLTRSLISYNASSARFHTLTRERSPACPLCG